MNPTLVGTEESILLLFSGLDNLLQQFQLANMIRFVAQQEQHPFRCRHIKLTKGKKLFGLYRRHPSQPSGEPILG